jgi:APA family basic amino acid/polyamine antiporter
MSASQRSSEGNLLKILGYGFGIAVVFGSTVGSGILRAPGMLADSLGSVWWSLAVWVLISVYALLGTMLMCELGVMMPKAGAWSVYARRAFGDSTGFAIGWTNWMLLAGTGSSLAAFVATLVGELDPALAGAQARTGIAVATLGFFTVLHWTGTRSGSMVQIVTSVVKAAAFTVLVAACFIVGASNALGPSPPTLDAAPVATVTMVLGFVTALQIVIFAFDGWYGAIYFAEEDTDPARNMPRSMINGTWSIIAIYLLIVLAIFWVLPLERIAGSAVAAADAADAVFGGGGGTVILLISLVAVPSVLNATLLQMMRVLYSLSRDGMFLPAARKVNAVGTPWVAMLIGNGAALSMLLLQQAAFDKLAAVTSYFMVTIYLSGFLSFWWLRRTEPEAVRSYRAPWHPWSTAFVIAVSAAFLVAALYSDTENVAWALALLALSYPVYYALKALGRFGDR